MDVATGYHTLYLIMTGAFAAALCMATIRRDGPSVLAMAFGVIAAGHLALLPGEVMVWACTAFAIATCMSLMAVALQHLCGEKAFGTGLVATAAVMIALVASDADAAKDDAWSRPLKIGAQVHRDIDVLIRS